MLLSEQTTQSLEKFLVANKLISERALDVAKDKSARENTSLLEALIALKSLSEDDATKTLALVTHTPFIDLANQTPNDGVVSLVPKSVAELYRAVPFSILDGELNVAMVDPNDLKAIDFLNKKTGYPIKAFMTTKTNIARLLSMYRQDLGTEVTQALNATEAEKDKINKDKPDEKIDSKNIASFIQDAPITRALNTILTYAIDSRASDIHIEPREHELKIRYRIDGILQSTMTLPKTIEPALISRIKIMSNLKIDEHRVPQDGQAVFKTTTSEVDLRISIAPISYGEQVVIRILDRTAHLITLEKLGFAGRSFKVIERAIAQPHGMILSTGPTGSGKTTTMYAVIKKINKVSINIVTLEDPIEYKQDGVNQIQVNPPVGLTFAAGLRSILRQDPNVIMVGEIRDRETADLAVQSALTGHLVLSTLHTNNASGVLPRLLDMKIEPFLIASTVNCVIGQRLVRKICDKCITPVKATQGAVEMINKSLKDVLPKTKEEVKSKVGEIGYANLPIYSESAYTLYVGKGCDQCSTGFLGRVGIYEVFEMNSTMEKLLVAHATTTEIQQQAVADGMITMLQDGLLKVLTGTTTIEEVARVASDY